MAKILILTAGFGNGHNAAAYNLAEGLKLLSEDAQVEVLDLFQTCYGRAHDLVKKVFLGVLEHTPKLWGGIYTLLDKTSVLENQMRHFGRLKLALLDRLKIIDPDVVVSTYPAYNFVINEIYQDHQERPFSQLTVVTDSLTINSVWHSTPSHYYFVPNQPSAECMIRAGVPSEKILVYGFPVSPRFQELHEARNDRTQRSASKRVLYVINHGKKKTGPILEELLEIPDLHLTITCGADPELRGKLIERTRYAGDRVQVLGWTNEMPELLTSSDLVITKAGGAVVQEAIAGCCPMIINQVIPGQEEGNAKLVELLGIGTISTQDSELVPQVSAIFETRRIGGSVWNRWKEAIEKESRPRASLDIAEFILSGCLSFDKAARSRQS